MPPAIQEVLEDLALFPDRQERIEALLALAGEYVHPSEAHVPRSAAGRVPGCESEVYFRCQPDGSYLFAVDNPQGVSAMALAIILQKGSGSTAEQIVAIPDGLVMDVFGRELSMGKSLGLNNMVRLLKHAASTGWTMRESN